MNNTNVAERAVFPGFSLYAMSKTAGFTI